MKIVAKNLKIRDIVNCYQDYGEHGVVGYGGKLDIRPPYQREFIYNDKQRKDVINTVIKGFPLNVMYWVDKGDETYEVLDGQQRTLSICEYVEGNFSIIRNGMSKAFGNLTKTDQDLILDYELMVYVCSGNDSERLEWFNTINIAGVELSNQEVRNANFTGPWLSDAKRYFSKSNSAAKGLFDKYMNVKWNRQEGLEKALEWLSHSQDMSIEQYMGKHQHDLNCNELWLYFNAVETWTKTIFKTYRKEMKGLPWGIYYNKYRHLSLDPDTLEKKTSELMKDNEIQKKAGIYEYLLDGKEQHLNLRNFDDDIKREVYEKQQGICAKCGQFFEIEEMQGDHITPWSKGGKTIADNCQMLCADCNRKKSNY